MEMSKEQIELLKKREIKILKEFIRICEKLDITYYVLGGTLLGAMRHRGFIPWDDDIDVGLLRKDFEKFRIEGTNLLAEWCFLQDCYSEKNFPMSYIKLRDNNSTFIESSASKFDINHGVFIDVFPIDFYPDKGIKKISIDIINLVLTHRINLLFNSKEHSGLRIIEDTILRILIPNYRVAVKARDKLYKRISRRPYKYVRNYCGAWGLKEIVPASYFAGTIELDFENIKVKCPKESEKYLTAIYGDYLTLPPIEKRKPHHYVDYVEFN